MVKIISSSKGIKFYYTFTKKRTLGISKLKILFGYFWWIAVGSFDQLKCFSRYFVILVYMIPIEKKKRLLISFAGNVISSGHRFQIKITDDLS